VTDAPESTTAPQDPASAWAERLRGLGVVLLLHLLFVAATWSVRLLGVVPDSESRELLSIWLRWLGLLQGIYVFPAVMSAALIQRWQLMIGMLAAAGVTGLIGGIAAALG